MVVKTRASTWVIPPQRAVWVPAGVEHETATVGQVAMRTIYVSPRVAREVLRECRAINVSPLLRELILRAATLSALYSRNGANRRLMQMILDEIRVSRMLPLHLPMPVDRRLLRVAHAVLKAPHENRSLEDWARRAGLSVRSLSRLFRSETALSFAQWRQQARLVSALDRLANGEAVGAVADSLGYSTPSNFIAMFRRAFGESPGRYFRQVGPQTRWDDEGEEGVA